MGTVSVTVSPPIRVFALVGVLVATGLAAFVFLIGRGASENEVATPTTPVTKSTGQTTMPPKVTRTRVVRHKAVVTRSGFPAPVDRALRHRRVVVVAVYIPGAAVDAVVRAEAQAAASSTRAGFVPISALNERLVRSLVAKTGVLPDPAVVIVRRPGVVTATLGVTDRDAIAQAVSQARR